MANVLSYINTGSFTAPAAGSSGYTSPPGMWCRPAHKPTCCMAVYPDSFGGSACCMCVPSNATCFVIEIWSQGGGGSGGCCCGVGSYGGQGGGYGWVACTVSGQNWILCACVCNCNCASCSVCQNIIGQHSRVCQCNGGINSTFWCMCGGNGGMWCCFPDTPWCWDGSNRNPGNWPGGQKYNLWLHWKDRSLCLAGGCSATSSSGAPVGYVWCCTSNTICTGQTTPTAATYANSTAAQGTTNVGGGSGGGIWDQVFPKTTCDCFQPLGYFWKGACGWSDPALGSSPAACLNGGATSPTFTPINGNCGGGMGVGGASYAGGHMAWKRSNWDCGGSCWPDAGRFPGGGGMTSHSGTAWQQPGQGASGLILMSWC